MLKVLKMKLETNPFNAYSIFTNNENNSLFTIPRFQREYLWGKKNWEAFFNDILEFREGYFIGSMIFIKESNKKTDLSFEVIDGQQRLITISLLLLALYDVIKKETAQKNNLEEIKNAIFRVESKRNITPRLQLQTINDEDYKALLCDCFPEWPGKHSTPLNAGNRKIFKAYKYFRSAIQNNKDRGSYKLLSILKKIQLVAIIVKSYPDASVLFTSLNTSGVPLTTIDLIKNSLFSYSKDPDISIKKWEELIRLIDIENDYKIQERFFRQNYNAFKTEVKALLINSIVSSGKPASLPSVATRANIFKIYDELFKLDATLDWCVNNAKIYQTILKACTGNKNIDKILEQLNFIEGSPCHTLLLFLCRKQHDLKLSDSDLEKICINLTHFFIRRHLTDKPATRTLDNLFTNQITQIETKKLKGSRIKQHLIDNLKEVAASDEEFKKALQGDLYKSSKLARYILANLYSENKEDNFWQKDPKTNDFIWTIEHVMPQTLSNEWKEKAFPANYNEEQIKQLHASIVHKLGNLTLSGYNQKLQNEWFTKKRDMTNDDGGSFIGYKNGIQLNETLKKKNTWNKSEIEKRTTALLKQALKQFAIR